MTEDREFTELEKLENAGEDLYNELKDTYCKNCNHSELDHTAILYALAEDGSVWKYARSFIVKVFNPNLIGIATFNSEVSAIAYCRKLIFEEKWPTAIVKMVPIYGVCCHYLGHLGITDTICNCRNFEPYETN